MKPRRCLVLLGGGGWYDETMRILERLSPDEFEFAYAYPIVGRDHSMATVETVHPGPRFPIHYLAYTKRQRWQAVRCCVGLLRGFADAWRIVRTWRPTTILALACASAVPLFVVGRLFGAKTVFVETLTRTRSLSVTGRIVHRLGLADEFFVQWPRLTTAFPGTRYAGAVI